MTDRQLATMGIYRQTNARVSNLNRSAVKTVKDGEIHGFHRPPSQDINLYRRFVMEYFFVFLANFSLVGLKIFNAIQGVRHHYVVLSLVSGAICLVWMYGTIMIVSDPFVYGYAYLLGAMLGSPLGSWIDNKFFEDKKKGCSNCKCQGGGK